jgi:regulatory protein
VKVTDIKQQVKRGDRYSIFIDGKYVLSFGESELLASGLQVGAELSPEEVKKLKGRAVVDKAFDAAIRYVAIRPRSQWELESYLKRKKVEEPVAHEILNKLSELGYVNDEAFAQAWVNNRRLLKPMSRRKLTLELRQKRVNGQIIDKVLGEDETSDSDTLKQLIDKKRSKYKDDVKLMQYLARQGYSYGDIKEALNKEIDE